MHHQSAGQGRPAIVFVHGYTCDHADWRLQVAALSDRHRAVACDLRGHGRTPGEPDDCSIETYGADTAALVRSLDRGPSILVGHSMGCRVVLEAARTDPECAAALVLVDGSCTSSGDPLAAERAMQDRIRTMGYAAFAEERFHDMFTVPYAGAQAIIERGRRLPAAIGAALFPRMARWDAQWMDAALAAVRVPLMVIQSTYMGPTLVRASLEPGASSPWLERVRGAVPAARIEVVTGVGHFTMLEAAERVNALLREFATGLPER